MTPNAIAVRRALTEDLPLAAALRWRWTVGEMGATSPLGPQEFTRVFCEWAESHGDTHASFLAFRRSEPVGMAWVALAPRVPSPGSMRRANAEVMSVYVVPEARGLGVGTLLVDAGVAWARDAGAEHAIVHSSEDAVSLYERAGFGASPLLLDQDLG